MAEGAGADPLAVFAASIEELEADVAVPAGRCSDLVARAPATADGHVWVAHNNDLAPESEDELVAHRVARPRRPRRVHDRDRALDQRRLQLGRAGADGERALAERRPDRHPPAAARARHRAPADARRRGGGGASRAPGVVVQQPAQPPRRRRRERRGLGHRCRAARPGSAGTMAHTNHYTSARMSRYEREPAQTAGSAARYRSARRWLAARPGHAGSPARGALGPHGRAGLAVPPCRARHSVKNCLLVPCRRHRRDDQLRSWEPVRLAGAALRLCLSHRPTGTHS